MSALAQSPCQCGHIINFENPEFLFQKVRTSAFELTSPLTVCKMSALDNPSSSSWLRTSFMDNPNAVLADLLFKIKIFHIPD